MKIINLTPHTVHIVTADGAPLRSFPSDGVARATQVDLPAGEFDGIPVVRSSFHDVVGLPDPAPGTVYIVSAITAAAARAQGRPTDDLFLTSGTVRDWDGRIMGCTGFALV